MVARRCSAKTLSWKFHKIYKEIAVLESLSKEAVVQRCSVKRVFLKISQNSQENTKNEIPAQMLSCEFCEISHNIFFKEPFGRLLHHKHSFCLLSHHDLSPFQKQCHTYFLAEYFFGLICRLGTRVNSIFQALSHNPNFNPVEHLRLELFLQK